mgnify:CR=1 FL=1
MDGGKKVVLVRSYEKRRASSSLKKGENDLDHKQLEVDLIGQNNVVINYENIIDIELYE